MGQRSLEQAVKVLNRVVGLASSPMARVMNEKEDTNTQPRKAKWIAITGQGSSKAPAEDGGLPDRRLSDYLALPVSQYSLLDPEWVERESDTTFCVTVPMDELTGLSIRPRLRISVNIDEASGSVTFSSETATLGDPILDREISLQLHATLAAVPTDDKAAFRQLARRKPPPWSPPPEVLPMTTEELVLEQQEFLRRNSALMPPPAGSSRVGQAANRAAVEDVRALPHPGKGEAGTLGDRLSDSPSDEQLVFVTVETSANLSGSLSDGVSYGEDRSSDSGLEDAEVRFGSSSATNGLGETAAPGDSPVFAATITEVASVTNADSASSPRDDTQSVADVASVGSRVEGDAESVRQQLAARVDLRVNINVPPPLRVVPGPLLSYAGGLVLKVALQQLLPTFLQLLAKDYQVWSSGTRDRDLSRDSPGESLLTAASQISSSKSSQDGLADDGQSGAAVGKWSDKEGRGSIDPRVKMPDGWQAVDRKGVPVN